MKYLLTLLAAFSLYTATLPQADVALELGRIEMPFVAMDEEEQLDFIFTTLYLEEQGLCRECVIYPRVAIADYPSFWGSWGIAGWYDGGDTVYLTPWYVKRYGLDSHEVQKTTIHEVVHFIDSRHRGDAYNLYGDRWQWSEENAWHVANSYWYYMGMPENANHTWHELYGFNEARPVTPWDPRYVR